MLYCSSECGSISIIQLRIIYCNTHVYTFHVCLCLLALTFDLSVHKTMKYATFRYDTAEMENGLYIHGLAFLRGRSDVARALSPQIRDLKDKSMFLLRISVFTILSQHNREGLFSLACTDEFLCNVIVFLAA